MQEGCGRSKSPAVFFLLNHVCPRALGPPHFLLSLSGSIHHSLAPCHVHLASDGDKWVCQRWQRNTGQWEHRERSLCLENSDFKLRTAHAPYLKGKNTCAVSSPCQGPQVVPKTLRKIIYFLRTLTLWFPGCGSQSLWRRRGSIEVPTGVTGKYRYLHYDS